MQGLHQPSVWLTPQTLLTIAKECHFGDVLPNTTIKNNAILDMFFRIRYLANNTEIENVTFHGQASTMKVMLQKHGHVLAAAHTKPDFEAWIPLIAAKPDIIGTF